MPSPIVDTLRRIAADECRVVSYQEEFRRLWATDPPASGLRAVAERLKRDGVGTLAIVWDGAPDLDTGPVDTTPYLTPLDWVVAVACELEAARETYPGFTVWILRLAWDRGSASETGRFVESIPGGQIPGVRWAHLVRLTADEADPYGPAEMVAAVSRSPVFNRPAGADAAVPDALAPVRGAWRFALTRSTPNASHHDLANLLGPQLLLEEPAVPDAAPLRQLVRSLGLCADRPLEGLLTDVIADLAATPAAWFPADADWRRRLADAGEKITVFFVDDLWRLGWGAVLCRAFGARMNVADSPRGYFTEVGRSARINVLATDGPDAVIDALRKGKDLRFAFSLSSAPQADEAHRADSELAVLDLRLFGGRSLADEADFFESLVEIARDRNHCDNLPWPPIDEDELESIEAWCQRASARGHEQGTRNEGAYLAGMTLLPRLIALADPSYPVIVFSSTGRRAVAEKLRPYRNLITSFEKPQVATFGEEDLAFRVASGFCRALGDALDLLAARRRCLGLPARAGNQDEAAVPARCGGRWTVQVFLDETGQDGPRPLLTVGGLVVVFPPGVDREEFARMLWTADLWNQQQRDTERFKNTLRDSIRTHADRIEETAQSVDSGIAIAAVAVSGRIGTPDAEHEGDALLNTTYGDNLHRQLVRVVLEGAVYDAARRLVPHDQSEIDLDVWLATRIVPLPNRLATEEERERYRQTQWQRWGIQTDWINGKEYVFYMNPDSARPLVEGILQQYTRSTFRAVGQTAVAIGLNSRSWQANFLHYVADALLSRPRDVPEVWWHRGFGRRTPDRRWPSRYEEPLPALLRAQRHLLAGRTVEALATGTGRREGEDGSLELRIQHRLREALSTLNGADIMRLTGFLTAARR